MSEYTKINREPFPNCTLPENIDINVWRYMDVYKFNSLINTKSLYLRRADLLQERFEGTYSREQILDLENWFKLLGQSTISDIERERRRKDRLNTYISCWCMSECDLDLMWKGYVQNPPGIAIKSTVRKLIDVCDKAIDHWPIDISTVTYFDHANGHFINYSGSPIVFFFKDNHFKLDNEIRIVHHPDYSDSPIECVYIPVDIPELIEEVVIQPKSTKKHMIDIRKKLDDSGFNKIPIVASRDDRELLA